jgi:hypothetical protein
VSGRPQVRAWKSAPATVASGTWTGTREIQFHLQIIPAMMAGHTALQIHITLLNAYQ